MDRYREGVHCVDCQWVLGEMLRVAYNDEKNDESHYRRMARRAKNNYDRKKLFDIADDEKKHQRLLRYVNGRLDFAPLHFDKPEWALWQGFCKELCKSQSGEKEGAMYYESLLERLDCPELKGIVKTIIADEKKHAGMIDGMIGKCGNKGDRH